MILLKTPGMYEEKVVPMRILQYLKVWALKAGNYVAMGKSHATFCVLLSVP